MTEAELYLNALVHYWSEGTLLPATRQERRRALNDPATLKYLDLNTSEEFECLFTQIASSNASLSEQDRDDLTWFVKAYGDRIARLLPETVPQGRTPPS